MKNRRLSGIRNRGTEAKSITSCDNAFVSNILLLSLRYTALSHRKHLLPQAAHRIPPGSFAQCESEASATSVLTVRKRSDSSKCFNCAKAKRQQQQSAQPERKSTTHYGRKACYSIAVTTSRILECKLIHQ